MAPIKTLAAALPFLMLAAGCDVFFGDGHRHPWTTYCDATGCYTCDADGWASPMGLQFSQRDRWRPEDTWSRGTRPVRPAGSTRSNS